MPSWQASCTWKAPTTAPAGKRSILRRLLDISWTRSTNCAAISWKMSEAGQDDCIFRVIGACARTAGAARVVPAAAAPPTAEVLRNLRREIAFLVMSTSQFAVPASFRRCTARIGNEADRASFNLEEGRIGRELDQGTRRETGLWAGSRLCGRSCGATGLRFRQGRRPVFRRRQHDLHLGRFPGADLQGISKRPPNGAGCSTRSRTAACRTWRRWPACRSATRHRPAGSHSPAIRPASPGEARV